MYIIYNTKSPTCNNPAGVDGDGPVGLGAAVKPDTHRPRAAKKVIYQILHPPPTLPINIVVVIATVDTKNHPGIIGK